MSKLTELELRVLSRIRPAREEYELIWSTCRRVVNVLNAALKKHGIDVEVTIQGSVAHDTWLSGDRDVDVFVLFPEEWSREDIERKGFPLLLEATRELGQHELRYAEHPYIHVVVENIEIDVVPGLRLQDPTLAKTAVDRTPFHTKYLNSVLTDELRDHIRLLKKFMKAIGVYGAEVKTRGFSGYATELLVVAHGGFREVLEAASRWKPPVFINTLETAFSDDFIRALRSKYPDSCIYMPDPVDPLRNVTASVSLRSLATLIIASKCYLKSPHMVFFEEPSELDVDELLKALKNRCVLFLTYNLEEKLPPDIIWGEVQRVSSRLVKLLEVFGVNVVDYSSWTNEKDVGVVVVELGSCILWNYKHYRGPCIVHDDERLVNFIRKHVGKGYGPWITSEGCLESMDIRSEVDIVKLLESRWSEYTVAPHLKAVKPSIGVASRGLILKLLEEGAGRWLRDFILKTPSWMEKCTF
ncbi:MAG: CCA tRNA nucleotidyltransferase [Desulfurococcaceae archaeon]